MIALKDLNLADEKHFVEVCGPFFELSPWIAQRAWSRRPFASISSLHETMCEVVAASTRDEQLGLIRAHPDLVGRMAREGKLTTESTTEQAAAGLNRLTPADAEQFEICNANYRNRFGFPFVICARENRKEAILAAFPIRLMHERDEEIAIALAEIFKIAKLRLHDAVSESVCP
jgi:2-oxo-4-hydroxy-4-carboxy-5-ureidoimidazoline decarboxylase